MPQDKRIYSYSCDIDLFGKGSIAIMVPNEAPPEVCNCLALRQATRHLSQVYDGFLAATGLRGTQFSILAKARQLGPLTVNEFARAMVMDRTTLGRNLRPLERRRLIALEVGRDRRSREIRLTEAGSAALYEALPLWRSAQAGFEARYGQERAAVLRAMLREVTAIMFDAGPMP